MIVPIGPGPLYQDPPCLEGDPLPTYTVTTPEELRERFAALGRTPPMHLEPLEDRLSPIASPPGLYSQ